MSMSIMGRRRAQLPLAFEQVQSCLSYDGMHGLDCGMRFADVTPIFFMWEKLVGTHRKPAYIRLPSRLPVGVPLDPCLSQLAWTVHATNCLRSA